MTTRRQRAIRWDYDHQTTICKLWLGSWGQVTRWRQPRCRLCCVSHLRWRAWRWWPGRWSGGTSCSPSTSSCRGLQCLSRGCVCVRAAGEAPPHCRGQLLQPPLRLCTHHTLHWARLRAGRAPRHRQLRGGGGETGPSPHIAPGYILSWHPFTE